MSADEDTELRDLVAQTLESNGVLGKIRAQLRASVFLALEEQEAVQNKTPFLNQDLKTFLSTKDGRAVAGLVQEFLEFFNLEFTQAVFEPEAGLVSGFEGREHLARELNISDRDDGPKSPLLLEVMHRTQGQGEKTQTGRQSGVEVTGDRVSVPQELTSKQLADARKKFDYYDRDKNGEIDKEELRELFIDLFPSFNRNMLDRYVNDEFRATDRDISNSISFSEFTSMYKRLFLLCRSVVTGDVTDMLSPGSQSKSFSSPPHSKASLSERSNVESRNQRNLQNSLENGPKDQDANTDTEEDFFDDPIPTPSSGYKSYGGRDTDRSTSDRKRGTSPGRSSQIPVYSALRSGENPDKKASNGMGGGSKSPGRNGVTGMSSLQGLPSLTGDRGTGRKSRSLPVLKRPRTFSNQSYSAVTEDTSENLRAMDKRMSDLGLDGEGRVTEYRSRDFTSRNNNWQDAQDYSYEDDFQSSGHSISQKSPRTRSEAKSQNGSIAEEIEEDLDDLSIEGDDLLRSEKSAFDDVTTDRTISQHESGFDYIEDLQSP